LLFFATLKRMMTGCC